MDEVFRQNREQSTAMAEARTRRRIVGGGMYRSERRQGLWRGVGGIAANCESARRFPGDSGAEGRMAVRLLEYPVEMIQISRMKGGPKSTMIDLRLQEAAGSGEEFGANASDRPWSRSAQLFGTRVALDRTKYWGILCRQCRDLVAFDMRPFERPGSGAPNVKPGVIRCGYGHDHVYFPSDFRFFHREATISEATMEKNRAAYKATNPAVTLFEWLLP